MEDLPLGQSVSPETRALYEQLRDKVRGHAQPEPLAAVPAPVDEDDQLPVPPMLVRPPPSRLPRRGQIHRTVDVTGISGLGVIAEFCEMSDGAVAYRWLGGPPQHQPKWEVYDNPGVAPFEQISGHQGNTKVVWLDEPDEPEEVPLGQ